MNRSERFGFDWGEFMTGVALLVAALIMYRNPGATMLTLSFIFAIIAIIRGIAAISTFTKLRRFSGWSSWVTLIVGIFDIAIGIFFLVDLPSGAMTLAYLFALWFLIDTLTSLITIGHLRAAGWGWFILSLLLNLVTLAAAFLFIMQPVVSAVGLVTLLALFFTIFGVNSIVLAIARYFVR
ncbi:DUF308 domain-containing protein [Lacticaseibacillus nasuensis]|uniref:DUF308 domain-containing protein n=1 Tax=Lacticaseibacillus nasuensis TaxID=944671 RepID=UPI00224612C6|nr:DUF308 domain-containing protein [Lacticaseibacillus nasuensis]MCX2454699.1 DUF308 domain-containing protein [Lacticaseibacillus nasuensis]